VIKRDEGTREHGADTERFAPARPDPATDWRPYPMGSPPYEREMPHRYVGEEQRQIWETRGRRGIAIGTAWLIGGLLLTLVTYANAAMDGGAYLVAWGPALYGVYRIVSGFLLLNKNRS
jgi:diadenosine tetraphosphatase ApaH/serine/threonine PP2A family protein phosphatase